MKPLNSESAQSTDSGPVNDRIRAGRGVGTGVGAGLAVGAGVGGGAGDAAAEGAGEPAGEDVGVGVDELDADGAADAVGAAEDDGWPPIPSIRLSRIAASTPMPATMAVAFIGLGSSSAGDRAALSPPRGP
jgi:hypothetical protein